MASVLDLLALASQRAPGQRSFQLVYDRDLPRLDAFFLSFDFDQRRGYFGGGVSDQSIRDYCRAIDWGATTIIARSGAYCLEAVATLVSLPPDHGIAEFSIGCPLSCNQRPIIAELLNLAIEIGALRHRTLLVRREHSSSDLMSLLAERGRTRFEPDTVELDLTATRCLKVAAC